MSAEKSKFEQSKEEGGAKASSFLVFRALRPLWEEKPGYSQEKHALLPALFGALKDKKRLCRHQLKATSTQSDLHKNLFISNIVLFASILDYLNQKTSLWPNFLKTARCGRGDVTLDPSFCHGL